MTNHGHITYVKLRKAMELFQLFATQAHDKDYSKHKYRQLIMPCQVGSSLQTRFIWHMHENYFICCVHSWWMCLWVGCYCATVCALYHYTFSRYKGSGHTDTFDGKFACASIHIIIFMTIWSTILSHPTFITPMRVSAPVPAIMWRVLRG